MDLHDLPEWFLDALNFLLKAAEAAFVIFILKVLFGFSLPAAILIFAHLRALSPLYKKPVGAAAR